MRLMTLVLIGCAFFPMLANGFGAECKNRKDPAQAFQGEWIVVTLGFESYELKGNPDKSMKVCFTKDQMTTRPAYSISWMTSVSFGRGGMVSERSTTVSLTERDQEATYRLDPTKTPAEIDLVEKTEKMVRTRKGIYRLKENKLELCIGSSNRPKDFKASTTAILLTLKRRPDKE